MLLFYFSFFTFLLPTFLWFIEHFYELHVDLCTVFLSASFCIVFLAVTLYLHVLSQFTASSLYQLYCGNPTSLYIFLPFSFIISFLKYDLYIFKTSSDNFIIFTSTIKSNLENSKGGSLWSLLIFSLSIYILSFFFSLFPRFFPPSVLEEYFFQH